MSESKQQTQKEPNSSSVPIYFSNLLPSNKNLLIGKIQLPSQKNFYKLTKSTQTSGVKEYTIIKQNENKFQYKGNENNQDSNYVLMKYNSKDKEIYMYPANRWVNFFKSTITEKKPMDLKEREKKIKQEAKKRNDLYKNFFNTNSQFGAEDKKKQTRPKKDNKKDEEESLSEKAPKKQIQEFKEDSHSSEKSLALADDSFESDSEKMKEVEAKKIEKEKEKGKGKEGGEEDENDSDDSKDDDKDDNSEVEDDSLFFKQIESFNMMGKKRERESGPAFDMEEKIENLLRKKNKMTYDEIIVEVKKEFKDEDIEKYFEEILDRITESFPENNEQYYFLKK